MVDAVLVGCGAMSKAWLEAADRIDGLSIVGLVDLDLDRARSRAAEFRLDRAAIGASLDTMLESRRADVVFDVVVPAARAPIAYSAFGRGCHLLSEKPLAASLEEARAVVAAARKADRLHAVVQNRRYHPGVRRIRRFLDSGALGRLQASIATFSSPPISAASARRWSTSCSSIWPFTLWTPPAP